MHLSDEAARQLKQLAKEKSIELGALAQQYVLEGIKRESSHRRGRAA
jgi:hypothetical protein